MPATSYAHPYGDREWPLIAHREEGVSRAPTSWLKAQRAYHGGMATDPPLPRGASGELRLELDGRYGQNRGDFELRAGYPFACPPVNHSSCSLRPYSRV